MTDTTPRKRRGPKRRYDSLVLVQAHVTPELRAWFETLPGNSNHERLQWLREQFEDRMILQPWQRAQEINRYLDKQQEAQP